MIAAPHASPAAVTEAALDSLPCRFCGHPVPTSYAGQRVIHDPRDCPDCHGSWPYEIRAVRRRQRRKTLLAVGAVSVSAAIVALAL